MDTLAEIFARRDAQRPKRRRNHVAVWDAWGSASDVDLDNDPLAPGAITFVAWAANPTSDTTPGFEITLPAGDGAPLDAAEDDVLISEYQANGAGSWIEWCSHTLTALNIADNTFTISGATPMSSGTHPVRFRLERGAHIGANTLADEDITINSSSSAGEPIGLLLILTKAA